MIYATALDFRQALEARLRTTPEKRGSQWSGFASRLTGQVRTSKDMDLAYRDGESQATADLHSSAALDLGDFFRFEVSRTSRFDEALAGAAVRYHLDCRLGRSVFDVSTIDVGFTDLLGTQAELLSGPPLLEFSGIAPTTVPALPLADHVSQKLHAWAVSYGRSGLPSSRSKGSGRSGHHGRELRVPR